MASAKKLQKQAAKAVARNERRAAKHEWKQLRKQEARNSATLAIGVLMGLEAVLMGMLSEWIFLAICCLLAFAALMSVRSTKGGAVVGAFVLGFSLYFTFLHINTLLVLAPHVNDEDDIYINGVAHKWSHSIWLSYVIKNSCGVLFMFASIILGIAAIVSALKGNKKDTRTPSPRESANTAEATQNVVIETYPPHPGPVLLQTAPLGQATLLQPAGVAYVTNVPPPPGVPYHTLNVAERPVVYQASPATPQFYTANPSHPTSPQFHPAQVAPGYTAPQQIPYLPTAAYPQAPPPPYTNNQQAQNQQQAGAYYQGV